MKFPADPFGGWGWKQQNPQALATWSGLSVQRSLPHIRVAPWNCDLYSSSRSPSPLSWLTIDLAGEGIMKIGGVESRAGAVSPAGSHPALRRSGPTIEETGKPKSWGKMKIFYFYH